MRRGVIPLLATCLLAGCASTVDIHKTELGLYHGDYVHALEQVQEESVSIEKRQGPIVRALDVGIVQHYAGDYQGSNVSLTEAEAGIEKAFTKSVSRSAASFVVNDNTKEYPGEDFEDIYINIFKALNYARLGEIADSMVEIRRSSEKQQVLLDLYSSYNQEHDEKIAFTHSALGEWLGMLFSQHLGNQNDVQYYARRVADAFDNEKDLYPFAMPQAATLQSLEEGKTPVYLLAFTNIEPRKQEVRESIWMPSGNWMTVAVSELVARKSEVKQILVTVDGIPAGQMEILESLSRIAINTYLLKKSGIYAKAVLRATGKLVATDVVDVAGHVAAASSSDDTGGAWLLADFATLAANLAGNLSERADVRMSHFFPGRAYIGSVDLSEGSHEIILTYMGENGVLKQERFFANVEPGRFYLMESFCLR
ncbi:MAG: hypothetical protein SPF89_07370 [Sphaerochaetaceae bacterium]|nr:hypothetical protein [Spirochaetales bacterium]MDY5499905.1 hypothetical protein [Sphaerochaetaceae bacterium]